MSGSRYRFTIEFEADRDIVPGWGHQVEDWIALATAAFDRQSHYRASYRVLRTEEIPRDRTEAGTGSSPLPCKCPPEVACNRGCDRFPRLLRDRDGARQRGDGLSGSGPSGPPSPVAEGQSPKEHSND